MSGWWADIIDHEDRISARLRAAGRTRPTCPECGTNQLQIMNRYDLGKEPPADPQWRCRMCKHRFSTAVERDLTKMEAGK